MSETPEEIIELELPLIYGGSWQGQRGAAHRIIAALAAKGFKILQREPTYEMIEASGAVGIMGEEYYRAMWDAAP